MSRTVVFAPLAVGALLVVACGAASPPASAPGTTLAPPSSVAVESPAPTTPPAAPTAPPSAVATASATAGEVPTFISEFDRVCETQVGFDGAAAYEPGPGIHPVVLFADWGDPPSLLESSATLPAGWKVEQDLNFDDNSELAATQLIACARRTAATPTGVDCEFSLSSGEDITLELTDTVYEVTVYSAATGEQIGETTTLDASETECPFSAVFRDGDTQIFNDPTDDQYINALKEFVAP